MWKLIEERLFSAFYIKKRFIKMFKNLGFYADFMKIKKLRETSLK